MGSCQKFCPSKDRCQLLLLTDLQMLLLVSQVLSVFCEVMLALSNHLPVHTCALPYFPERFSLWS